MLQQREMLPYLLRRGLVDARSVVDGELTVVAVSGRNRLLKVIGRDGPYYLLKQGIDAESVATVAHEAAVYCFLQAAAGDTGLLYYLPAYVDYDAEEQVLVLELLRDAESLRTRFERRGRFSTGLAAALAEALARLHRLTGVGSAQARDELALTGQAPWVLSVHRPNPGLFRRASHATLRLLPIVQGSAPLCQDLDLLRERWTGSTLIHRDVKWDNCLVTRGHRPTLKLVDWELADLGDPCWDVGSVFASYLDTWLFSIPITGEQPPDRFLELARYPLETMQPAIRAFWQAYARHMALQPGSSALWLLRAARYGGARLLQFGIERTQVSPQLTGELVYLVQLSLNVLQRPHEAIVHLLGIPLDGVGTA